LAEVEMLLVPTGLDAEGDEFGHDEGVIGNGFAVGVGMADDGEMGDV
jgi:hypothetical protein